MVTFQAVENNGDGIFQELANISSTLLTVQGGQPQPASMQKAGWIRLDHKSQEGKRHKEISIWFCPCANSKSPEYQADTEGLDIIA